MLPYLVGDICSQIYRQGQCWVNLLYQITKLFTTFKLKKPKTKVAIYNVVPQAETQKYQKLLSQMFYKSFHAMFMASNERWC